MDIVILDTGCANLSSVKWAVQRLGYEPQVSREADSGQVGQKGMG